MTHTIILLPLVHDFAQNKDIATDLRQTQIMPYLAKKEEVILDFSGITGSTQSFIHALIAEPLQVYGTQSLNLLKFKSACPILQTLIGLVIDYSTIKNNLLTL